MAMSAEDGIVGTLGTQPTQRPGLAVLKPLGILFSCSPSFYCVPAALLGRVQTYVHMLVNASMDLVEDP